MSFWSGFKSAWRAFSRSASAAPGAPVTGHPDALELLSIDAEGWLRGPGVEHIPSVRHSQLTTPSGPIAIVWHYTAVRPGVPLWDRIRTYKRGVDRAASWHVIVEADGRLYQSVPFLRGAWHCGKGLIDGHRVNACSVGIELASVDGKSWPESQIEGAENLLRALAETYGIKAEHAAYGHSEFDPKRRADPGPVWKNEILPRMLDRVNALVPL